MRLVAFFLNTQLNLPCRKELIATDFRRNSSTQVSTINWALSWCLAMFPLIFQVILCALVSRPMCARTRAHLRGNIVSVELVPGNLVFVTELCTKSCRACSRCLGPTWKSRTLDLTGSQWLCMQVRQQIRMVVQIPIWEEGCVSIIAPLALPSNPAE